MAVIRWDPFKDLITLREKMNRLFEETYSYRGEDKELVSSTWSPSVDIYETEHELVLSAEVPGISDKDIEIKIEDNTLTLKGERTLEKETQEENYHRLERAYGSFYRSFTLPHYINQENIKAEHEKGVLKIHMPKKPELKPRNIKILKPVTKEKK
ncbi:Hsp20/alpha crystallin family protein [Acidobacteriota bacterium]